MTLKIKICGITNENDLKNIEKLKVNHIGFINIERSKRYVSLNQIKNLQNRLINKHLSTLVLETDNSYEVIKKMDRTQIFNIQLHSLNQYDIKYIKWSKQFNDFDYVNITKVIGLKEKINEEKIKELKNYSNYADSILLDYVKEGLTGGTNRQIPIETAIKASEIIKKENDIDVILAGGLNYKYLESISDKLHFFDQIDLNSGVEDKPGEKILEEIKKIQKLVKNV